jgi:hypothetical protein
MSANEGVQSKNSIVFESMKVVLAAAIGAIVSLCGAYMTFHTASRDLDIRMVDISLSILSGDKGVGTVDEKTEEYLYSRTFALRSLAKYSGVDIPPDDLDAWAKSGKIAFGPVPSVEQPSWSSYLGRSLTQLPGEALLTLIGRQEGSEVVVDGNKLVLGILKDGDGDVLLSSQDIVELDPEKHCIDGEWLIAMSGLGLNRPRFDEWVSENCPNGALVAR